jgi:hypothetical protein
MTDEELIDYLGLRNEPKALKAIGLLTPERRALFDRMKQVEIEAELWAVGLGPKPHGVLLDTKRSTRRRKGWR